MNTLIQTAYKEGTISHEEAVYLSGYAEALSDYGIWDNGVQRIDCLQKSILECFTRKLVEIQQRNK